MRLKSKCNGCHRKLEIEGEAGVNAVVCPSCGGTVRLPQTILEQGAELGDFKIKRHIGSGSMGDVYLATQMSMERDVAIKVLPPDIKENQESLDNFLAEVRTLAKLDHPNIVTAFQAGDANGLYFLAMTYVNGGSLEDRVESKGPLPEAEAIHICLRVAQALRYAWDRFTIIHRDIKPENIMIDTLQGEPKILDLGISKMIGDDSRIQSETGVLIGTPHYMSPEQAEASSAIDFRSDMYSLGCTLFRLVTGKVPFDGYDPLKVLMRHIHDPIPDPTDHNPDLHPATCELITHLMAKDADDRFSDWTELVDYIKDVLHEVKSPNMDFDTNTRSVPRRRRRPPEAGVPSLKNPSDDDSHPDENEAQGKLTLILLTITALLLILALVGVIGMEVTKRLRPGAGDEDSPSSPVLQTRPLDSSNGPKPDYIETVKPLKEVKAVPPQKQAADDLDKRVRSALSATARTVEEATGLITKLEHLTKDTRGTVHAKAVEARLKELRILHAYLALEKKALKLHKQGRIGPARRLVREYSGPYAEETKEKREKLLPRLRHRQPANLQKKR